MIEFLNAKEFEKIDKKSGKEKNVASQKLAALPEKIYTYILLNTELIDNCFESKIKCEGIEYLVNIEFGVLRTQYKVLADQLIKNGYLLLETKEEENENE